MEAVKSTKTNSLIIFKCVQCLCCHVCIWKTKIKEKAAKKHQASNQLQPKHPNTPNLVLCMIKSAIQPQKISTISQLTTSTPSHHIQKTTSLQCQS